MLISASAKFSSWFNIRVISRATRSLLNRSFYASRWSNYFEGTIPSFDHLFSMTLCMTDEDLRCAGNLLVETTHMEE